MEAEPSTRAAKSTDALWSPSQLADYLDVPVATTHQWASQGRGPRFYKVGRHRRYREADVRQWLEQQASRPTGDAA